MNFYNKGKMEKRLFFFLQRTGAFRSLMLFLLSTFTLALESLSKHTLRCRSYDNGDTVSLSSTARQRGTGYTAW